MSLYEICQALQDSAVGTSIRESIWTFPIIETVHVLGLAVSVGILVMLDLRLVGAGMRDIRASDIMHKLKRWYLLGFAAMFGSGALLFWSEAEKCYRSPTFRIKLIFLALAGLNALFFEDQVCAINEELGIERRHAFGCATGGLVFVDLLDGRGWIRTMDRLRDEVIA